MEKLTPSMIGLFLITISLLGFFSVETFYERAVAVLILFFGSLMIYGQHKTQLTRLINRWITRREQAELRVMDLKIVAAENGFDYSPSDNFFVDELESTFSEIGSFHHAFQHFMSKEEPNGRITIFEYGLNYSKSTKLVGTAVKFDHQTVPTFVLMHKRIQQMPALKPTRLAEGEFRKLDKEYFPGWLFPTEFECFFKGFNPYEVSEFLAKNRPFSFVTNYSSVRLLIFNQHIVSAFYERRFETDGSNFSQFQRLVLRMLELAGNEIDPPEKLAT